MKHLRCWLLAGLLLTLACASPDEPKTGGETATGGHEPGGPFHFVDIAREAGLDVVQLGGGVDVDYIIDALGSGAAWLDYDSDGDPDLYLAQGATLESPRQGPPDRLFRNDGDDDGDGIPTFTDVTEAAGLGDVLWSFGAAVADYDGDGDPDLHLTNWGPDRLYRNNGDGTFDDIAAEAGLADPGWGASAAWSDVDRDGDLDLFVSRYVEFAFERISKRGERKADGSPPCEWRGIHIFCGPRGLEAAMDRFYRNEGDPDGDGVPTFTDRTFEAGLAAGPHYGLGAVFLDADLDGDDDLYVANDSVQNAFFINRGDGTFEEGSLVAGLAFNEEGREQAGMGVTAGDYDGDGYLDLAVTNFSHDHDTLYRNEANGFFIDRSYPSGLGSASFMTLGWGIQFLDLDHDADNDLLVAHGHVYPQTDGNVAGTSYLQANGLFRNNGDGTFDEVTAEAGPGLAVVASTRASASADIDGDGDLDILLTNRNDVPTLLRNDGAPGNWLRIRLRGRGGNRDGIGAVIKLTAGGETQLRQVHRNTSFLASSEPQVHFGLGDATRADTIEVRWPSGEVSTLGATDAGQLLEIDEPAP